MSEETNTPAEEIISRPNHLRFIALEVDNYAGLNYENKALVIHFPENENITEMAGDQGVGKTSLISGLKTLMGEPEPANAINSKVNSKSASLTFEVNGETYKTRVTSKSFSLVNIKEGPGQKIITSNINKPKDILASLIGPIGVSPSFLQKKKSGDEQIEWIKELAKSNPALAEKENKIKSAHQQAYTERTGVNRDVVTLRTGLVDSTYYKWDEENKVLHSSDKFSEDVEILAKAPQNDEELKTEYDNAFKESQELQNGKARLDQLLINANTFNLDLERIDQEISRLQAMKVSKKEEQAKNAESIQKAKEWIEERKENPVRLQKAQADLQNSGKIATLRQTLNAAAQTLGKYKEKESRQEELNNLLYDYENQLAELAKEYTPNIDGLEVELGNSIDSKRSTGVYYKGTNIAFLSESELWDLCLQVWRVSGISVVFIENSTSLGTDAIQRINWFAENGGKVFMSTMQRGYKELSVSFHKLMQ